MILARHGWEFWFGGGVVCVLVLVFLGGSGVVDII